MNERIAEFKARIAEGGEREAAIRAVVYIGMAGSAVDERRFAVVRQIRAERGGGLTLEDFKHTLRKQFFALLLDQKAALAAIPKMLSEDPALRKEALEVVSRVVTATGELEGEKAKRMAEIEQLFGAFSSSA
jgi:hypothetical protein